jgi:GTP-binding protein EngB required for normal cell division
MLSKRFQTLDVIEQIRPLLQGVSGEKLVVPGVVVIGAQSSGKSSVLENATGLAFPRGEGMCTRVPTVVSVQGGCKDETLSIGTDPEFASDVCVIDKEDTETFGKTVVELTNKLTRAGEVADTPIYVRLKQKTGPTFTLTDVPGITVMSAGTRGNNVEKTTTALTRKMIGENDETLVLVVIPATDDFHNSKALQLAMELDPEGQRTIGVVTKIDNLPPGSDLVRSMSGADFPLKHGYYAVRNRTQLEINEEMQLDGLKTAEEALFASDPVLQQLPTEQRGMSRLLEKIYDEQGKKIDEYLPRLRTQLSERLREDTQALARLPLAVTSDNERVVFLNRKLGHIQSDFRKCASADTSVLGPGCRETNLSARVHETMTRFADEVRGGVRSFLGDDVKEELKQASSEALGYNLSNFMQGSVFRHAFSTAVSTVLKDKAEEALSRTSEHVQTCFAALVDHHIGSDVLPAVRGALKQRFNEDLVAALEQTWATVSLLQRAEANVTFTSNHYYAQTIAKFNEMIRDHQHSWRKGGGYAFEGVDEGEHEGVDKEFMNRVAKEFRQSSNDESAVRTMQISLHAYAKVVQKRFCDTVAAIAINEMVLSMADEITGRAHSWATELADKVQEDPSVARRRTTLLNNVTRLQKAYALLQTV